MYCIKINLVDGGAWWWRLLVWFRVIPARGLTLRTDREWDIQIQQGAFPAEGPIYLTGYVGAADLTTKVSWRGSACLARRTPR